MHGKLHIIVARELVGIDDLATLNEWVRMSFTATLFDVFLYWPDLWPTTYSAEKTGHSEAWCNIALTMTTADND